MKSLPYKLWVLILGVAVAAVVIFTMVVRNSSETPQKAGLKSGVSLERKTSVPRIANDFLRFVARKK